MKYSFLFFFAISFFISKAQSPSKTKNIFVITIDGVRWKEIFEGADQAIITNSRYTSNIELAKLMYMDSSAYLSRKKLLPFFWTVIDKRGRLYGNRLYDNKVKVANRYKFSYPGYNEILTGYPDGHVNSNKPVNDPNSNILEYINSLDGFKNKVVAFTSWNIFPYILNESRNHLPVYSGYDSIAENGNIDLHIFNKAQENLVAEKTGTREDALTFLAASEYVKANQPKVVLIGLGECDEDGHHGKYDLYLQHLNEDDKMIAQLWYYIQSTPEYKDKTTLIITTDHGRGKGKNSWRKHDELVSRSGNAWLAIIGPDIKPEGEMQLPEKLYQKQIAATIVSFLGYEFTANHPVAKSIDFGDNN